MFSCARICVEVDLEKALTEAINISIDGWNHLQTMDYEQIPFKCKYFHEYGHFTKSCPEKQEKSNPEGLQEEGWNVASGKKTVKTIAAKQPHILAKSASENRYDALQTEEQEIETPEENAEEAPHQEQETPTEVPPQKEKNDSEEDIAQAMVRKEASTNSEGLVTRFRAKACSEEFTDNSIEEQEPHSRKGRKSNKTLRE